ncbi:MAG: hypothetical protein ACR2QM_10790, partial [Longimicrobiales bacterium]
MSGPWLLVVGAVGLAVAATGRLGKARAVGLAAMVGVVVVGFVTERADLRYGAGWDEYWSVHQSEVADQLASEFDALVARGDAAVGRLGAVAASGAQGSTLADS